MKKGTGRKAGAAQRKSVPSQSRKKAPGAYAPGPGLKKEYLKSRNACKVVFRLPKQAAPGAGYIAVVGDFNEWNPEAHPMKKLKNGDFTATIELTPGKDYQFRYLIDGERWENDWQADAYVQNPFGAGDNSVVAL